MIIDRWVEDRHAAMACMTLAILIGALSLAGNSFTEVLRYDRLAIEQGEYWRILTGHLVHAGTAHTLLNMAGLVLIALLFPEPLPLKLWAWRVVLISIGISALMYWHLEDLGWYVGLSGTLHGLFVLGFWWLFRQGDRLAPVLLVVLLGKLVWEHFYGAISSNEALVGVPVLVEAHSYGALCALIYLIIAEMWTRYKPRSQ